MDGEKLKKIIVIAHQTDRSGAPTSLLNMIKSFKENDTYEIYTIAMRGGERQSDFAEYSTEYYQLTSKPKTNPYESFLLFFKLLFIFFRLRDIEIALINSSSNLRAVLACLIFSKKSIMYVRESENMHNTRFGFLRKRSIGFVSGLICVSYDTMKWVKKYARSQRVEVIHNGLVFPPKVEPLELGLNKIRKRIGIVGYLNRRKGVDRLYDLMCELLHKRYDVEFIIIGDIVDAFYREKILSLASEYQPSRVLITGIVEDVNPYIRSCDVTLMLSREEALPRVVMESSYNKIPVVAVDVAGTKEMLPPDYQYMAKEFSVKGFECLIFEVLKSTDSIGEANYQYLRNNFDHDVNISKVHDFITRVLA